MAQNFICAPVVSNADASAVCPLYATDDKSVVSYTIISVPSSTKCSVYLYKALVTNGQVISPAQASQITYKPSGSYVGYAEILYTATDNNGAIDSTAATITLQLINQPPVAQDISDSVITNPSGAIKIPIPALSATDIDGSIANYTITNIPGSGLGVLYYNSSGTIYSPVSNNQILTLAQAGSLKFDPVDSYTGIATFKFTATDNGGLTDNTPATYNIPVKVTPPNADNIINASIYTGAGLTAIKPLTAIDKDSTNIITAFVIKDLPASSKGTLYYNNGGTYVPCISDLEMTPTQGTTLKFNPFGGFTGNATFTFTAKDDEGLKDPTAATFTIPITNQAPTVSVINNAVVYDTAGKQTIKPLAATDADGSITSYIILSIPDSSTGILSLGGVPIVEGQFISPAQAAVLQFDPALHNSVDAIFRYTALDNFGLADASAATFTIPISPAPYKLPPTADSKTNPTLNLRTVFSNILPLSGNDPDGVITSYQITGLNNASQGTLYLQGIPVVLNQIVGAVAADQFTFIPSGSFQGTSKFTYVSIDNDSNISTPATFNIPLKNSVPVANNFISSQVAVNSTVFLPPLQASDSDGTISSYKILSLPSLGTLLYDFSGNNTVYKPVTVGMTLNVTKASRLKITAGSVAGNTSFTFTAKDNFNDTSNVGTYTIPIGAAALNQLPIPNDITSISVPSNGGQSPISSLSASDVEGGIMAYVIEKIPPTYFGYLYYDSVGYYAIYRGILKITPAQASTLKFSPSGIYAGNITFTYKAIDSANAYSAISATYTIPITDNPPVLQNITNTAIPNSNGPTLLNPITATTTGTIVNYVITALPNPAHGILIKDGSPIQLNQVVPVWDANRIELDPESSFTGNGIFKFTAIDKFRIVNITPANFTIPITNQPPLADNKVSQVITNFVGTSAQSLPALSGVDKDGTISSYIIKSLPANGKLYYNGTLITILPVGGLSITPLQATQLSFDPNDNFGGISSFNYTAKDNNNNVSIAAATYQIILNTPPISSNITAPAMFAGQGRSSIPPLAATDDGTIVLYSILTLPSPNDGTLFLNNAQVTDLAQVDTLTAAQVNQLSFQPSASFAGTLFSYTATDNVGLIDVTPSVFTIPYVSAFVLAQPFFLTGNAFGKDNKLQWNTSQDANVHHFDVEHSFDGSLFTKIGLAANTDYVYTDKNVISTLHYYRIKQFNADGKSKYSNVVLIKRDDQVLLLSKIMPNPFKDKLMIDLISRYEGNGQINLYDLNGKNVKSMVVTILKGTNHLFIYDLPVLSSGMYLIKIKIKEIEIKAKLYKN